MLSMGLESVNAPLRRDSRRRGLGRPSISEAGGGFNSPRFAEVDEALAAGAGSVSLDNMSIDQLAQAVQRIGGRALVEASGGINLSNVAAVAATGVDIISIGALTHSVPAVDLHMTLFLV